jgi:hypothetical protein
MCLIICAAVSGGIVREIVYKQLSYELRLREDTIQRLRIFPMKQDKWDDKQCLQKGDQVGAPPSRVSDDGKAKRGETVRESYSY